MATYLEHRYSASVRGSIAGLTLIGTLSILAGQLIAGAAVLNAVAGLPRWQGVAIGGAAMTIYFTAGGLLSSAWVNAVQLVVMIGGFVIALPLVLSGVGGFVRHRHRAGSAGDILGSACFRRAACRAGRC